MSDTDSQAESQAESTEITLLRELVVLQKENNEQTTRIRWSVFGLYVTIALFIVLAFLRSFAF